MIRELDDDDARREIVARLERPFRDLVFNVWDPDFLETPEGKRGMETDLVDRYLASRRHAVPWLAHGIDLPRAHIVEIGCGTGASTVAMAERCAFVTGFDVDPSPVDAARARVAAHGTENVRLDVCAPNEIMSRALEVPNADLYVLFAVLEHLTIGERLDALRSLWAALRPGGSIAIIETPNRLTYRDSHSSETDFLHLLPDELAFALIDLSPRAAYRDVIERAASLADPRDRHTVRVRFGLGASYHEFLAAIDEPLQEIVVLDGYEDEITSWFGVSLDEIFLLQYFLAQSVDAPCAFARAVLNLVLRKPASDVDRSAAVARNEARRHELSARYPLAPIGWNDPAPAVPHEPAGSRSAAATARRLRAGAQAAARSAVARGRSALQRD